MAAVMLILTPMLRWLVLETCCLRGQRPPGSTHTSLQRPTAKARLLHTFCSRSVQVSQESDHHVQPVTCTIRCTCDVHSGHCC